MKILTVSQFGQQIKWSPHPSPSSFWALSQVTLRHSLRLQGQWLLQPNKDLSPSSSFFSGAPKGRGGEDGTHPREARLLTRPWVPSECFQHAIWACVHPAAPSALSLPTFTVTCAVPHAATVLPEPPRAGAGLSCTLAKPPQSCPTLCYPMDYSPPGSSVHGRFPRQQYGVGCHSLLRGIFPTQGLNPCFLHCS